MASPPHCSGCLGGSRRLSLECVWEAGLGGKQRFTPECFTHVQLRAPDTAQGALGPLRFTQGCAFPHDPTPGGAARAHLGPTAALQDLVGHLGIHGMESGVCQGHCGALQGQFKVHGNILGEQGSNLRPQHKIWSPVPAIWGQLGHFGMAGA